MARWNTCRSQRASCGTQDAAPRASISPAKPVKLARAGKLVKPPAGAAGHLGTLLCKVARSRGAGVGDRDVERARARGRLLRGAPCHRTSSRPVRALPPASRPTHPSSTTRTRTPPPPSTNRMQTDSHPPVQIGRRPLPGAGSLAGAAARPGPPRNGSGGRPRQLRGRGARLHGPGRRGRVAEVDRHVAHLGRGAYWSNRTGQTEPNARVPAPSCRRAALGACRVPLPAAPWCGRPDTAEMLLSCSLCGL